MKIAITRRDKPVAIMTVIGDADLDETINKWRQANPGYLSHRIIDESEIPADRTFRDAWTDSDGITIDMPKAREIHKQKLRQMRAPKLAALDIDYQRADESGDAALKAKIAKKKQELRDVTSMPEIAAAQTPEELKAAIPAGLLA